MSASKGSKAWDSALCPIASFARIKPESAEKGGGAESAKAIIGWDEGPPGTVKMSESGSFRGAASSGSKVAVFDHLTATLPPQSTQLRVYETIAQPLVRSWLDGFDADIISYGQTGSGKTFTMFGPPHSMAQAAAHVREAGSSITAEGVLREEHGMILRAGLEALAFAAEFEHSDAGGKAAVHGSMVELSIASLQKQTVSDLLNGMAPCYVDSQHHLQGAAQVALASVQDLVAMLAAVEQRSVRGTRMNDTSSRSHCVTVLTLSTLERGHVRQSRLQFFDLMGSERFKGPNAAHDSKQSSQASAGGWEGIFANLSLTGLSSAVELAAEARRSRKKGVVDSANVNTLLTALLMGGLTGAALTCMVTCLSQAGSNGSESALALRYSAAVTKLLNLPQQQPAAPLEQALASARARLATSAAVVAQGVQGRFQARRQAEVHQHAHALALLERLHLALPQQP